MVKTRLKRLNLGKSIPINRFFSYALYKLILSEITIVAIYAESVGAIMISHLIKTFVQNTTFLVSVCRPIVVAGILTGYSFSALTPISAEAISYLPIPAGINLTSSPKVGTKLHQVQTGDTLYSLTQMYQVDAAAIATSNGISATTPLPIGTQLVIPPVNSIIYKVQPNDTLSQVANLYQVPQDQIAKASGLLTPDDLRIEQPLVIPGDVKSLLTHRQEKTIQDLTLKRDLLRQRLQLADSSISNLNSLNTSPSLLTAKSWSSRFHFQADHIPVELAILPESEARMTTVELFQLTRDIKTLDSWLDHHEQVVASTSLQARQVNPSVNAFLSIPDSPDNSSVMIMPTEGTISSGFGWRWGKIHKGIDIAASTGTPVWAAASGVVEFAGWDDSGYGNMVDIHHHDGVITRYAHLSHIYAQQGSVVNQSQVIGAVGSTGNSTGPHLHFETITLSGVAVDPISYLTKR
jgi:murein DD-endopeptidase MepM/ murein hydrolase activator NlpD